MSSLTYCRIKLSDTNYQKADNAILFVYPPVDKLKKIYFEYCQHKKFTSVMPLFESYFTDTNIDIWGYNDQGVLVAFSIVKKHDQKNVESLQFAWNYKNSKLELGHLSLEHECATYRALGYEYLYLGEANKYKSKLTGYEILGSLQDTTESK
jgi:hypothetical protein